MLRRKSVRGAVSHLSPAESVSKTGHCEYPAQYGVTHVCQESMVIELGQRILVMGNSCSGKSTLAARLATHMDRPHVNLDAINWQPDWVGLNATDPDLLEEKFRAATASEAWVVSGSYTAQAQAAFWDRLDTMIWLDLRMPVLLARVLRRSWRRWRNDELLWGTNKEKFWPQLAVWRGEDSLVWWIVTQHYRKRRAMLSYVTDPRWRHVRFVRFRSAAAAEEALGLPPCDPASVAADAAQNSHRTPIDGTRGSSVSP